MENKKVIEEVNRCITCNNKPCKTKCPLENDVTEVIKLIKQNEHKKAYELLCDTTVLQSICGRICPHEKQCQSNCTRKFKSDAISIGEIEASIGDMAIENDWNIPTISSELKGKKVAIVGGGPSGLTCASFLAREGTEVTIYEKHGELGGILRYGIPEFRLDKKLLKKVIDKILKLGIKTNLNMTLEKDFTLQELEESYDAIFLGIGANVSRKMKIPGEELNGVFGGNELLENSKHPNYLGKIVYVCGGGNVAMDTARTAKKMGAERVIIAYRRSEEEMPAEKKEIKEAKEEGIEFLFHTNIIKILGDTKVEKIECVKTKYQDDVLVNVEGTNYELEADYVLMAIGSTTEKELLNKLGIELNEKGNIKAFEKNKTSRAKVFAGGDLIGEKATVAWAASSGRKAARGIKEFLK